MARTLDPPITLIVDPDDDLACLEELRRLHARPYGQILCEPDPTATSAELARYLLRALGKDTEAGTRGQLWILVDCHMRVEHVRDLAVVRAQTLSYAALRDLADHTHAAGAALWLLTAGERPTVAITQLLEARPHDTATPTALISRWAASMPPTDEPSGLPAAAGYEYPRLQLDRPRRDLTPARLCQRLPAHQQPIVNETWRTAERWTTDWISLHPDCTNGQLADAVYELTWSADTASEILTRSQAAIAAIHSAEIPVDGTIANRDPILAFGEMRPYQWRQTVHRAATLVDHVADPHTAAIIALSVIYRDPAAIRRITVGGIATDGSLAATSPYDIRAIPRPLRGALAAQRQLRTLQGANNHDALLPGRPHGHASARSIQNTLNRLDAPQSLWTRTYQDDLDGAGLDGRTLLHRLNPVSLFPHR